MTQLDSVTLIVLADGDGRTYAFTQDALAEASAAAADLTSVGLDGSAPVKVRSALSGGNKGRW